MIYTGENKSILYRGDFHPAELYKGDKKIAGYELSEFQGTGSVTLENCYNDTLYETKITGSSAPEAPTQVQITVRGKNFIDKNIVDIKMSNCFLYEKNGDSIIVQGNEGLSAYAASGGNLRVTFPETLPGGTYTFSVYITLLEEGIWGTGMRMYAGADLDSYTDKIFYFDKNTVGLRKKFKGTYTAQNGFGILSIRVNGSKWLIELDTLQIESGNKATDYEPFVEPQTERIYLTEESVTLPTLPTFKGTTVIEAEATISGKYKRQEVK